MNDVGSAFSISQWHVLPDHISDLLEVCAHFNSSASVGELTGLDNPVVGMDFRFGRVFCVLGLIFK